MEKKHKLTEAEEKQIKILKMRMIRDNRENEIDEINKEKSEDDKLDIEVKDIEFLGNIKFSKEINGENQDFEFDIYRESEIKDGQVIPRYYEENSNLLGIKNEGYGIMITEQYRDIEDELIAQIEILEEREISREDKKEALSLNKEETELAREILKKSNKDPEKDDIEELEEEQKEDEEEIPEEELKKLVPSVQEVDLNQLIDDRGTKLGNKLNLGGEYTKLTVARTDQVRDITDVGATTEFTILAYNASTGNLEPIPGLEMDSASGNDPRNESMKVENDKDVAVDNKIKSRFIFKGTNTTLGVQNGQAGEIEVYLGSKAKTSNEYFETQLETSQVWPTPKQVRALQKDLDRGGNRQADDNIQEGKEHMEHGHKVNISHVDGEKDVGEEMCEEELQQETINLDDLRDEIVEIAEKTNHTYEVAEQMFTNYLEENPDRTIEEAKEEIIKIEIEKQTLESEKQEENDKYNGENSGEDDGWWSPRRG